MSEASGDIFRATVGGIWVALGAIVLVCGFGCLIGSAAGAEDTLWCGVGCSIGGPLLIAAGAIWYYLSGRLRISR